MKKMHAAHNEEVCNYLTKHGKAHDWIVTTAFYSALHYVQNEIFPLAEGYKTYVTFDEYYRGHFVNHKNKQSQHQVTINLAFQYLGASIGSRYNYMHDACRKARYHHFKMNPLVAEQARKYLSDIKETLKK